MQQRTPVPQVHRNKKQSECQYGVLMASLGQIDHLFVSRSPFLLKPKEKTMII
jgi:hypothetical protein